MGRNTSIETRKRVIELSQTGKSYRDIAALLSVGKSTVSDIIATYHVDSRLEDRPRTGRPRKTTERVDRIITRKSVADVRRTAAQIAHELHEEGIVNVSRSTVTRRLHDVGLFGRIGIKKPLITKKIRGSV